MSSSGSSDLLMFYLIHKSNLRRFNLSKNFEPNALLSAIQSIDKNGLDYVGYRDIDGNVVRFSTELEVRELQRQIQETQARVVHLKIFEPEDSIAEVDLPEESSFKTEDLHHHEPCTAKTENTSSYSAVVADTASSSGGSKQPAPPVDVVELEHVEPVVEPEQEVELLCLVGESRCTRVYRNMKNHETALCSGEFRLIRGVDGLLRSEFYDLESVLDRPGPTLTIYALPPNFLTTDYRKNNYIAWEVDPGETPKIFGVYFANQEMADRYYEHIPANCKNG